MRLLAAYDRSDSAEAALRVAGALFDGAEALVAHVDPEPLSFTSSDWVTHEGVERLRREADDAARATLTEGVARAEAVGLHATSVDLHGPSPWRALHAEAATRDVDLVVCGTRGVGAIDRVLLGSTASSLVHHTDRPLLVVPAGDMPLDGPIVAGYDSSEGARGALRFAAAQFPGRELTVTHAWRSPVRHTVNGYVLTHSGVGVFEDYAASIDSVFRESADDVAEEGADLARGLGLHARSRAIESGDGDWQALVSCAHMLGASAILVGTRGGGALTTTVLGSVASGLVHAAELPVLLVP